MRLPRSWSLLVAVCLIAIQFSSPAKSHADTYSIVGLGIDNVLFYGMDSAGQVVLQSLNSGQCGFSSTDCYGHSGAWSATPPNLNWDFVEGKCVSPQPFSSPCTLSYGSRTAEISTMGPGQENLYVFTGVNAPQLLYSTGFGPIFAMNSRGDIVFDDGLLDEWYEAIDLDPTVVTPEPSSLLLLATGLAGTACLFTRRRALI